MAFGIEEFCKTPLQDRVFGARALHQLTSYIKAAALRHDENEVTEHDYGTFKHLFSYFNYDCSLFLPQTPQIGKSAVTRIARARHPSSEKSQLGTSTKVYPNTL